MESERLLQFEFKVTFIFLSFMLDFVLIRKQNITTWANEKIGIQKGLHWGQGLKKYAQRKIKLYFKDRKLLKLDLIEGNFFRNHFVPAKHF